MQKVRLGGMAGFFAFLLLYACSKPNDSFSREIDDAIDVEIDLYSIFGDSVPEFINIVDPGDRYLKGLYGRETPRDLPLDSLLETQSLDDLELETN